MSWGLGPSTSAWNETGLGGTLYYRQDGLGFNHFPKGLHLPSSVVTRILDRSGEEICGHAPYKHMPQ